MACIVLLLQRFSTSVPASTSGTGEFVPGGLAFDATGNLWVADGRNNRVIEYVAPFVTGEAASLVLGQSSFTSNTFATSATGEGNPGAVAFDSSGNLWVVDTTNSRVLEYSAPFSTDEAASLVLGQSSFTTSTTVTTASGLMYPEGLAFDSGGNLWVTDNYNNRVLEYAPSSGSTATTSTSSSTSSATSTVLTTTTLTSCTGNSAGNGIFGVCVEPSSIDQGGTVAVTGYAFGSGSTYVLNVTEPDGARFGTEFYSYSCSTAPCSTSATFPTDFTFQILGTFQTASTSQPGTYYASTCAYSAPRY